MEALLAKEGQTREKLLEQIQGLMASKGDMRKKFNAEKEVLEKNLADARTSLDDLTR